MNIKKISTIILLTVFVTMFLSIEISAANWSIDEAVSVVETRLNQEEWNNMKNKIDSRMKAKEYLNSKNSRPMILLESIAGGICILASIVGLVLKRPEVSLIPIFIFLFLTSFILLFFNSKKPTDEDIAKAKIELGLEVDVNSNEYIVSTTKEMINEIYSKGDTVEEYTQEEAIKEVLRLVGISRGKINLVDFKTSLYW